MAYIWFKRLVLLIIGLVMLGFVLTMIGVIS